MGEVIEVHTELKRTQKYNTSTDADRETFRNGSVPADRLKADFPADPGAEASRLIRNLYEELSQTLPPGVVGWTHHERPALAAEIGDAEEEIDCCAAKWINPEENGPGESADALLSPAAQDEWRRFLGLREKVRGLWLRAKLEYSEAGRDAPATGGGKATREGTVPAAKLKKEGPESLVGGRGEFVQISLFQDVPACGGGRTAREGTAPTAELKKEWPEPPGGIVSEVGEKAEDPQATEPLPSPWEEWLGRIEVRVIRDAASWRAALAEARAVGVCGIDTETTGLDPVRGAKLAVVQLAVPMPGANGKIVVEDGRSPAPGSGAVAYVLPIGGLPESDAREALAALVELLADPAVTKIGQNLKFDLKFIRHALGRRLPFAGLFDTMLASQLYWAGFYRLVRAEKAKNKLKPEYPHHSLADLARRHLGFALDKGEQTSDWGAGDLSPEQVRYAAWDAAVLLPLYEVLSELLRRNGLGRAAALEFGCLPAVAEMELSGMWFDAARAREIGEGTAAERDAVRARLVAQAKAVGFQARPKKGVKKYNPDLNPASPEDVLECLKLMGHEVKDTSEQTLNDLAAAGCGFAADLLEFRGKEKTLAFIEQWTAKQCPADNRIHPEYVQLNPNGVGRFSCRDPNLQQCPRGSELRRLFCAPEGRRLVIADYSGIELRIMAWLSGDQTMIEAFQRGEDLHRLTAASIAGKPPSEVTKAERQAAKVCNFGLIYGCGPGRLVDSAKYDYGVDMPFEEARKARERFFETYRGVARWHEAQQARLHAPEPHWFHSYEKRYFNIDLICTRTVSGRKRVWGYYGGHTLARVTELFNTPDQGTGADILKCALAGVYGRLLAEGREEVKIVGSVHDELILEAPEATAGEIKTLLEEEMRAAGAEFIDPVPADVEGAVAGNWADKA